MQTYQQTFAGATTWQLNVPGSYFVTLQCTNTVNVRFYKGGKKLDLGDISGLLAGLEVGPIPTTDGLPFAFDRVEIDVTGADTIKVGIGNGMARYSRFNGTVDINSFAAGAAAIVQRPEAATGFYSSVGTLAANTADQIFSAAANINGALLLNCAASDTQGTYFSLAFLAKATAPVSVTDGEVMSFGVVQNSVASNPTSVVAKLDTPQFIPAGKGLYFICSTAFSAAYGRSARYKLL
jgi:hypothetical protein